ncbi:hypothetical protein K458DRAFT_467792 [Lentithecium fluviatile CBS 122367]|uniref:Secreted protein n=1 Tax=Lentithecium fluviatile CBS 122367 TaxID=1168545 RepID=A0A6G1JC60_9PLEO|nr:hypothetical protein K458DRAFT_467792 [Lentithecium fluviatile CBS 122367]
MAAKHMPVIMPALFIRVVGFHPPATRCLEETNPQNMCKGSWDNSPAAHHPSPFLVSAERHGSGSRTHPTHHRHTSMDPPRHPHLLETFFAGTSRRQAISTYYCHSLLVCRFGPSQRAVHHNPAALARHLTAYPRHKRAVSRDSYNFWQSRRLICQAPK